MIERHAWFAPYPGILCDAKHSVHEAEFPRVYSCSSFQKLRIYERAEDHTAQGEDRTRFQVLNGKVKRI